jgi:hypothetical protein
MRFPLSSFVALLLASCVSSPADDYEYGYLDFEPEYEPTAESLDYPTMPDVAAPMAETTMSVAGANDTTTTVDTPAADTPANNTTVAFVPIVTSAPRSTTATTNPQPTWIRTAPTTLPASSATATAVTFRHSREIQVSFSDRQGRRWSISFVCDVASDSEHEQLAATCIEASTLAATEVATDVCQQFDLDQFAGIAACESELASQLTALLAPCGLSPTQASVQGIRWTHWRVD